MNKRYIFIILLFALLLVTGCEKKTEGDVEVVKQEEIIPEESTSKTLSCEYNMTQQLGGMGIATYTFTLTQDRKTYELTSGEAVLIIDYTDHAGITAEDLAENLDSLKNAFCGRDYYGEGTTKECTLTSEEKVLTANIVIDIDAFLKSTGVSKKSLSATTLEGIKENLESSNSNLEPKCTIE